MKTRTLVIAVLITLAIWLAPGCSLVLEHGDAPLVELRMPSRIEVNWGPGAQTAAGRTRTPVREMTLDDVTP